MELSKKITDILDNQDFYIISVEQQNGEYIAELKTYSPEGEEVIIDIWFNGTNKDFIDKFDEYADDFDPDEHAERWIEHRGEGGCPSSIRALIDDADAIKRILTETAAKLRTGGGK